MYGEYLIKKATGLKHTDTLVGVGDFNFKVNRS